MFFFSVGETNIKCDSSFYTIQEHNFNLSIRHSRELLYYQCERIKETKCGLILILEGKNY